MISKFVVLFFFVSFFCVVQEPCRVGCLFFLFSFCFVRGRIGHASSSLMIIIMISPLRILIPIPLMGISHFFFFLFQFLFETHKLCLGYGTQQTPLLMTITLSSVRRQLLFLMPKKRFGPPSLHISSIYSHKNNSVLLGPKFAKEIISKTLTAVG